MGPAATRSLDEALQLCLDAAIRVSGLDSGGIYLAYSSGGLSLACSRGISSDFLACISRVHPDSNRWRLIQIGRPSYQNPGVLGISTQTLSQAICEGLQAIAIIPVLHQSQIKQWPVQSIAFCFAIFLYHCEAVNISSLWAKRCKAQRICNKRGVCQAGQRRRT